MRVLFAERLKRLGYSSYEGYLNSDHWQSVKEVYKASSLPQVCYNCSSPKYELHHRTYKNLGRERMGDLVPLCHACHGFLHKLCKEGVSLGNAHDALWDLSRNQKPKSLKKKLNSKGERRILSKLRKRIRAVEDERKRAQRKKREGFSGQMLIQCVCGRRAWQDSPYCCSCGVLAEVVKRNPEGLCPDEGEGQ